MNGTAMVQTAREIESCSDKVAVLKQLFGSMKNDHPDAAFCMGVERICGEVQDKLLDVVEAMGDSTANYA